MSHADELHCNTYTIYGLSPIRQIKDDLVKITGVIHNRSEQRPPGLDQQSQ
jgi:hypothetical protein